MRYGGRGSASARPLRAVGVSAGASKGLTKKTNFNAVKSAGEVGERRRRQSTSTARRVVITRAQSNDSLASFDTEEAFNSLKEKWDETENKAAVLTYAGVAVLGLVGANAVVGFANSLPVLPQVFELVGLGYSAWFVNRYLLYKENRREMWTDFDKLKDRVFDFDSSSMEDGAQSAASGVASQVSSAVKGAKETANV